MNNLSKYLLRFMVLLGSLLLMNYIYTNYFYEDDLQKNSEVINLVRAVPDETDILYIGESSNNSFESTDVDQRKISGFLQDHFVNLIIHDITKPASHAGNYKILLAKIPLSSQIKTVVVTLNLRSFNAQWVFSDLETALQKSMVLLQDYPPLFNRFLLSFKAYEIKTREERNTQFKKEWIKQDLLFPYSFKHKNVMEWDVAMSKKGILNQDGSWNKKLTELACHYVKGYAFQIDTINHIRIKDFNEIMELAKKRGWNLVINLLAENTQKAKEMVGDDLIFLMEQNRVLLKFYFENKGYMVVDNLNAVDSEHFTDQDWTTEHYDETGRKIIAANIAKALKFYYPEEYRNAQ